MRGRTGINAADGKFQLSEHQLCFFLIGTHYAQTADTLAVQRQVFRERVADKQRQAHFDGFTDCIGIVVQILAETLIGNIHKRNQLVRFDNIQHFIPLCFRHIYAGRVLTAWMQNQDAVFRQCFEKRSHFFKFHADGFRVVIRIRPHFKTCAFKNTFMVVPSRVADIGFRFREPTVQKVGTDFQRPRAA